LDNRLVVSGIIPLLGAGVIHTEPIEPVLAERRTEQAILPLAIQIVSTAQASNACRNLPASQLGV
jgi:hypothetical protein